MPGFIAQFLLLAGWLGFFQLIVHERLLGIRFQQSRRIWLFDVFVTDLLSRVSSNFKINFEFRYLILFKICLVICIIKLSFMNKSQFELADLKL